MGVLVRIVPVGVVNCGVYSRICRGELSIRCAIEVVRGVSGIGLYSQNGIGIRQDIAHIGITGTGIICSQCVVLYRDRRDRNFDILYILLFNNLYRILDEWVFEYIILEF